MIRSRQKCKRRKTKSVNSRAYKTKVGNYGSTWTALTGTTNAIPGQLKQTEIVDAIFVDSSSRAVIVGSNGTAPSNAYGPATVWRLNNADVVDASHHWRPWVNGLPVGTQPINGLSGQYENGVFYIYAATWGRGIWKREARGGDL